jgi:hypothetical protein
MYRFPPVPPHSQDTPRRHTLRSARIYNNIFTGLTLRVGESRPAYPDIREACSRRPPDQFTFVPTFAHFGSTTQAGSIFLPVCQYLPRYTGAFSSLVYALTQDGARATMSYVFLLNTSSKTLLPSPFIHITYLKPIWIKHDGPYVMYGKEETGGGSDRLMSNPSTRSRSLLHRHVSQPIYERNMKPCMGEY